MHFEANVFVNQTEILLWLALSGSMIEDDEAEMMLDRRRDGRVSMAPWERVIERRKLATRRRRQERITEARAKGTHTKAEWTALADVFGQCVRCGIPYHELNGGSPTKDHIIPIMLGGCDCIANIQPMCRNCNSARSLELTDHRPLVRPDWARAFTARLENGWR